MIQIDLPCCEATALLAAEADTVRCEACALEHLLAPDARPSRTDEHSRVAGLAPAA